MTFRIQRRVADLLINNQSRAAEQARSFWSGILVLTIAQISATT